MLTPDMWVMEHHLDVEWAKKDYEKSLKSSPVEPIIKLHFNEKDDKQCMNNQQ